MSPVRLVAAAASAGLILLVAAPGSLATSRAGGLACTLIAPTQLHSILGLSQSQAVRDSDPTVAISEAVHTECIFGAWSGPAPTSPEAALLLAKSGRGAQVAIQTWEPHDGSPNVKRWIDNDYGALIHRLELRSIAFWADFTQIGWPSKHVAVVDIAHHQQTDGVRVAVQGKAKGLVAALACWWDDKTYTAICLLDEEAAGRPVVKHLNELAKIAVTSFG